MKFKIIFQTSRQVVIEILNGDIYETEEYQIYLNENFCFTSNRVIQTIDNLHPDTSYQLYLQMGQSKSEIITFITKKEFVTLNVKDFGAKGDGKQNDTVFIQSAISACPYQGRVLIPKGIYKITSIFLKDDLTIEIAKGAVLSAITDRKQFPVLPGLIESYDETSEYNLGTWEGNPLNMFAGIITGIHVSNVVICGQGMLDGNASYDNWWKNAKVKNIAFRPRLIFLNRCNHVDIVGITIQNSPSWCIHPYYSTYLKFLDLTIINPKDSPNTDGLNPESCKEVEIAGVFFSTGDDCIAIKSGKNYMGAKYKISSENIKIRQCYMKDGHGSVTIGSEMSAGVKNLLVTDCKFSYTDRGLRIKTRRGRGKDGIIDSIVFDNVLMDQVMTPIVINSFYYCDPDGHSDYVKSKEALPVDERTPSIQDLTFQNIKCTNCHLAAAYIYGLPEKPIHKLTMKNISIDYANHAKSGIPAMMDDAKEMTKGGIIVNNIESLELSDITINGYKDNGLTINNVEHLMIKEDTIKLTQE